MNKTEKVIYELLKKSVLFCDEKGIYTIFPQKLLIKASGKSERTVRNSLKELEEQGYIIRELHREVNLLRIYFLKEETLTGGEIIDHFENCPSPLENDRPPLENCPSPLENDRPPLENYPSPKNHIPPITTEIINTQKLSSVNFPLDKVNSTLWYGFPVGEVKNLKAESDKDSKKGKQASILLLLDFAALNGVNISRELTVYDKWVWNACANLKEQGNDVITAEQIYKAMGNTGKPNAKIKEKIMESVETISRARVTIDTTEEHELYPKYERIKATFPLLATETCTAYARGQIVESAIKIIDAPKLFAFAENRQQVTRLPLNVLDSPVSKTGDNLLLSDYLLTRISKMRNSKYITRTILLDTIYQKCGIDSRMKKSRLPEKIERILNHYKELEWIKDFKITEREIEIITF